MRTIIETVIVVLLLTMASCRSVTFQSALGGELYVAKQFTRGEITRFRSHGRIEPDVAITVRAANLRMLRIAVRTDDGRIAYMLPGEFPLERLRPHHFHTISEVDSDILRGAIQQGMDTRAVVLSWGYPFHASHQFESVNALGRYTSWRYGGAPDYTLSFRNDQLSGWTKF